MNNVMLKMYRKKRVRIVYNSKLWVKFQIFGKKKAKNVTYLRLYYYLYNSHQFSQNTINIVQWLHIAKVNYSQIYR